MRFCLLIPSRKFPLQHLSIPRTVLYFMVSRAFAGACGGGERSSEQDGRQQLGDGNGAQLFTMSE